jgi:hypothetical protein
MAIDRYKLVTGHNPVLEKVDVDSPLTVGNGEFAFTADVTGLQTLYREYEETCPLCTMSQWGWHTQPVSKERYAYTLDDLVMTEFDYNGRKVIYPKNAAEGNEEVYEWLRKNPHRLNLARIGLEYRDKEIQAEQLDGVHQELDLYQGILKSRFTLDQALCEVETCCDSESDSLGIRVSSPLLADGGLTVALGFPYGSPNKSASDFGQPKRHTTEVLAQEEGWVVLRRTLDRDVYYVVIRTGKEVGATILEHRVVLGTNAEEMILFVGFSLENPLEKSNRNTDWEEIRANSIRYWKEFWEEGAILQMHNSPDPKARELERRMILSMYLLAINSCGSAPPQETGLTCNSWYGKMHLEMYFWHCAWAPLWGHTELLERSLPWYMEHLPEARENAARNSYKGARWPKMIALGGVDSPSKVAPMLLWQQPHIIFMLELCYRANHDSAFQKKYWQLVKETADFMADIAVYNAQKDCYELVAPVIPVQECHRPNETLNPAFEVSYWKITLEIAARWGRELSEEYDPKWEEVSGKMAGLTAEEGVYLAHEKCPLTYTVYNHDHPSMLMSYGVLRDDRCDPDTMGRSLDKILECWNYPSLWGWDFAVMAMTAVRLGNPSLAIDILLKDTPKNDYVVSGNNRQKLRKDLPLYLPGNGSLMLALSLMAGGYEGCEKKTPGFPEGWVVEAEGLPKYI